MAGGLHPLNPPKSKTEGGDDGGGKVDSAVFFRARDAKCGAKLASVGASHLEATEKEAWLLYEQVINAPEDLTAAAADAADDN
eukprot:215282-Rhodomonas_salina.2